MKGFIDEDSFTEMFAVKLQKELPGIKLLFFSRFLCLMILENYSVHMQRVVLCECNNYILDSVSTCTVVYYTSPIQTCLLYMYTVIYLI